jgi:DNA-directed RNA polymerase specialized sigma24 family protein
VARASAGDQGAWDQLVARYGGLVWAVARAHGLRHADASEVSQVTWLLLTQHLASLPVAALISPGQSNGVMPISRLSRSDA